MPCMAKKKPKSEEDPHRGISIGFRADRQALVDTLGRYADQIRRSRNMAMILLLEKALAAEGLEIKENPK